MCARCSCGGGGTFYSPVVALAADRRRRNQDPVISAIEQRLAVWTHLPQINQEDMQVSGVRGLHGEPLRGYRCLLLGTAVLLSSPLLGPGTGMLLSTRALRRCAHASTCPLHPPCGNAGEETVEIGGQLEVVRPIGGWAL